MKVIKILLKHVLPVFLISLLVFALRWFICDWNTDVVTAIYQLKTPLDGTNPDLIVEFCKKCMPVPALLSLVTGFLMYKLARDPASVKSYMADGKQKSPSGRNVLRTFFELIKSWWTVGLCLAGFICIILELRIMKLDKYLINLMSTGSLFEENYVPINPADVKGEGKNLILIYAESMEITYASRKEGGGKPENLIPDLTNAMNKGVSFSDTDRLGGLKTMPGASWTMGGLFSSMTATPLKLDLNAPDVDLNQSFCPKVTSLGDILKANGYKNYFQCGSDAVFGGRKAFFTQHGDYEIYDYSYAVDKHYIPEDYHVFWGYEDRKLFDIAKKELSAVGEDYLENKQSFNYTMLTVDTHHPAGYRCELCKAEHSDPFADIVSCSDAQISDFLRWIETQAWSDDTLVVVLGDHTSMVAGFWYDTDGYENKPINLFINSGINNSNGKADLEKNRLFTHFDLTPTILEMLGFELPDHRMGLGVSLLSGEDTLIEEMGQTKLYDELCKSSRYYNDSILK